MPALALLLVSLAACGEGPTMRDGKKASQAQFEIAGERSYLSGYPAVNDDGSINVVVEIPAGTNDKWEVSKPDGRLRWEFENDQPRVVRYLAYPGNYGMVPRTLLPKESGGDGDPLDVIVLGPAVPRGTIVQGTLVGVLKLLDRGEQDDKLVAIMRTSPLAQVRNLSALQVQFPGVLKIIETWFQNYKGPGKMVSQGFADVQEAEEVLHLAVKSFAEHALAGH